MPRFMISYLISGLLRLLDLLVRCDHCGRRETAIEAVVKTAKEAGVNAGMRHLWNQVFQ